MKKLIGGVKKNIFYISLIAGMAVLVAAVGLYNAKTNTNEEKLVDMQDSMGEDNADISEETKETISGREKTEENTSETVRREQTATDTDAGMEITAQNDLHFDAEDGISWPLTGNVIIPYSMDTTVYFETLKTYKCSPAMVIEAEKGAEVKAVYDCRVSEVSSSPELGNYVVLDLGDGYLVTLGQLEDVRVPLGTELSAGNVVGTVGEPSRFYTEEGTNLYFAIEKDGQPVDPMLLVN